MWGARANPEGPLQPLTSALSPLSVEKGEFSH